MVMEFWGSDIRMPSAAAARNPYYVNAYNERDSRALKRMRSIRRHIDHAVVADHELREYAEKVFDTVHVVPQRIDVEAFPALYPTRERSPVVVHAPSRLAAKGTEHVLAAVERLRAGYEFEFVLVQGLRQEQAMAIYRDADIVVDQLTIGAHGVFAVESMALGKPVLAHIRPDLIGTYPPGFPVVAADPGTIEPVLERLIADFELRERIGRESRAYALEVHDCRRAALRLKAIYESL